MPWSNTEMTACCSSNNRPFTLTVAAMSEAYCLCYSSRNGPAEARDHGRVRGVRPQADLFRMRVLNAAQMREADRRTIDDIGIPSLVLMENAGQQAVAAMEAMYSDLLERRIAILCGRGNNGGDGCVVART